MKQIPPPPFFLKAFATILAGLLATAGVAVAQPTCNIAAKHGTEDRSISSLGNNMLTVDEGGNWFLELTFSCTGITNTSTHSPTIQITGITPNGKSLWEDDTNPRFSGSVWKRDVFGPTNFGGNDPAGDFSARVRLSGTSVDNNCHDTGASTQMQFTAKIGNTITPNTDLATRTITVTARDDDPLKYTLKISGRQIDWKPPCLALKSR